MRRNNRCAFWARVSICLFLFQPLFMPPVQAQITNPALWSSIVTNVAQNPFVIDTFLIQSFEGKPSDTWGYTTHTGVVFDASADGIVGQGGNRSLKLLSNTNVVFNDFDTSPYNEVKVKASFAAKSLSMGESLTVQSDRTGGTLERVWAIAQSNNYALNYRQPSKGEDGTRSNPIQITLAEPYNIRLQASELKASGYFCIDSVLVQGEIPTYSLFTGKGRWSDAARWSHLTPARRRSALVNGEVTLDADAECNQILFSDGSIQVNEGKQLTVNNLTFFGGSTSLISMGDVMIAQQVSIERTFAEVGVWYFISFPFDVYPASIEAPFQLKDATPNAGGNYIYVRTYNGEKRSQQSKADGNWEVISPTTLGDQPLFRKNKGYLIALDEKATKKSVTFSSASGTIAPDFGKMSGQIPVVSSSATDQAHAGWYLCGNPFPGPLSLSQIASNTNLDGNIYVYEGAGYKSYSIGSNYMLPPSAAFFVKAKSNTQLQIKATTSVTKGTMLSVDSPLRSGVAEPTVTTTPASVNDEVVEPQSYVKGNILYTANLPRSGKVTVYDLNGRVVYGKQLPQGTASTNLPIASGYYLVKIESDTYRAQYKCSIVY